MLALEGSGAPRFVLRLGLWWIVRLGGRGESDRKPCPSRSRSVTAVPFCSSQHKHTGCFGSHRGRPCTCRRSLLPCLVLLYCSVRSRTQQTAEDVAVGVCYQPLLLLLTGCGWSDGGAGGAAQCWHTQPSGRGGRACQARPAPAKELRGYTSRAWLDALILLDKTFHGGNKPGIPKPGWEGSP